MDCNAEPFTPSYFSGPVLQQWGYDLQTEIIDGQNKLLAMVQQRDAVNSSIRKANSILVSTEAALAEINNSVHDKMASCLVKQMELASLSDEASDYEKECVKGRENVDVLSTEVDELGKTISDLDTEKQARLRKIEALKTEIAGPVRKNGRKAEYEKFVCRLRDMKANSRRKGFFSVKEIAFAANATGVPF